jgi:hypothetical protein
VKPRHRRRRRQRPQGPSATPTPLDIPLSALHLHEIGELQPWHRLLGTLQIAGLPFHVDAIAVQHFPFTRRAPQAAALDLRDYFATVVEALRTDEPFGELRLRGSDGRQHTYVLLIHPYERS